MMGMCYCEKGVVPGSSTRLGHVHAASLSPVEWAKGVLAIEALAGDSRAPWLADLPKAARKARAIMRKARSKT